jgi:hypothetical protein
LFPTPRYPTPDNNKTTFFGNGFYPYAYYKDSFITNSDYKKLLIKDDLNGIKYLSCNITNKYDWTIFYIDTKSNISSNDKIIIKGFFKDKLIPVDLELNFLDKNLETNTNRIRVNIETDFVSEISLRIKDYFDCSDESILTSVKFVLYNKNRQCSELCLTEFSLNHSND